MEKPLKIIETFVRKVCVGFYENMHENLVLTDCGFGLVVIADR